MLRNFLKTGRSRLSTFSCMACWPDRRRLASSLAVTVILICLTLPVVASELSLEQAITRAEEHNYSISSARHDSAAAAMVYAGVRAQRFPVLSLEARSYYVDELQTIGLPFGSQEIGSKENYQADIKIAMPLYTGARLSNRIGIERENSDAAGRILAAEKMASAHQCRQTYLNVLSAQTNLKIASASLERLEIILRDVRNLFQNGLADSIDILEAQLARQKGEQQVTRRKNDYDNAMASLKILIGAEKTDEVHLSEVINPPAKPAYPADISPEEIYRPELDRYDHLIRASELAAAIERGALAPNLSGYAGYTYGKPNKDMSGRTWNDNFLVGVSLNWELNLGGKSFKYLQSAKNRAASARMAKKNLLEALLTRHDVSRNNLNLAYRSYQISKEEYRIAADQFRLAQSRQDAGQISINRLLEVESDLSAGEQRFQASIIQFYLAENEYLYAVGSSRIFGGLQ